MTFSQPFDKQSGKPLVPWESNDQIWEEWVDFVNGRGALNTQRNKLQYPRYLFQLAPGLVHELNAEDLREFIRKMEPKCTHYRIIGAEKCNKKLDLARCPMESEGSACPSYQPILPSGVKSYLDTIHQMYAWMCRIGRISFNPMSQVRQEYEVANKRFFEDRKRDSKRRKLNLAEVQALIQRVPLRRGLAYALMAKCFLRCHEVLKLRWDEGFCNLEGRWMLIPNEPGTFDERVGNKRIGNNRVIIDDELHVILSRYKRDWDRRVKRDVNGDPVTQNVVLTQFNDAWGANAVNNFRTQLGKDARHVGLSNEIHPADKMERVTTHCFRSFATTYALEHGCPQWDLHILRGDIGNSTISRYDDHIGRLRQLYADYSPQLGLLD